MVAVQLLRSYVMDWRPTYPQLNRPKSSAALTTDIASVDHQENGL
jgi:hypothetical protein